MGLKESNLHEYWRSKTGIKQDGQPGGTAGTVAYAKRYGVKVACLFSVRQAA